MPKPIYEEHEAVYIGPVSMAILRAVARYGADGMTVNEIAEAVGNTTSRNSISSTVTRLRRLGYLVRWKDYRGTADRLSNVYGVSKKVYEGIL